ACDVIQRLAWDPHPAVPGVEVLPQRRHQLGRVVGRRIGDPEGLAQDDDGEEVVLLTLGLPQCLAVGAHVELLQARTEGGILPVHPPPELAQRWAPHWPARPEAASCSSNSSISSGSRAARRIASTASMATQTLATMMTTSRANNSQSGLAGSVKSATCSSAAQKDMANTSTSGTSAGRGLRRLRIRITAMIDNDNEAINWLVVPNSGQMRSPPSPLRPWENVSPRPTTSTIRVAGTLVIRTRTASPISCTTNRSSRIPVSIVVAANSTAMVASTVALTPAGSPMPFSIRAPPPCTNASTPPSPNAL